MQKINDIDVYFPFKPYDQQTRYIKGVLDALINGQNALLESPTGTGKTLSLLCSVLAWLKSTRSSMSKDKSAILPKIIYTSRTHS